MLQIVRGSRAAMVVHPPLVTACVVRLWPSTCPVKSDFIQCASVVLDVLFFTVWFRHCFHEAMFLFLIQLQHPWENLTQLDNQRALPLKLCDVHRLYVCTCAVSIVFAPIITKVLTQTSLKEIMHVYEALAVLKSHRKSLWGLLVSFFWN